MNEAEIRALYEKLIALRSDPTRAQCVAADQVLALAETSLAEADRLPLLRHVSQCTHCQRDLSLARSVVLSRPAASIARWAGLAAAATVLIVAMLILRPRGDNADIMRGDDSTVSLVAPAGTVNPADTVFTWHAVPRAREYHMELLTPGGSLVHSTRTRDTTVAVPQQLLVQREYYWRVSASLTDGSTRASAARQFRVR